MRTPAVQRRERESSTDGRVAVFATEFSKVRGSFGSTLFFAEGPFEVSASRVRVRVHYAKLATEADFDAFREALIHARVAHLAMAGEWGAQAEGRTPTLLYAAALALAELEAVQTADGEAPSTARAIETLRAAIATAGGAA